MSEARSPIQDIPLRSGRSRWRSLRTAPPSAFIGMTLIAAYGITATFAGLIAPYGQAQIVSPEPFGE